MVYPQLISMRSKAEKTVELLNSKLPIHLNAEDVEHNPGFVTLLKSLSKCIYKSGAAATTQKDLEQAESELRREKGKWLEQRVLLGELQELLLDNQLEKRADAQFYEAVGEMVTLAEIGDYLQCNPDPSIDVTLLGLTQQDIDSCNQHKQAINYFVLYYDHKESIQQKLIPELETRLRKRCEKLVCYHDNCTKVHDEQSESREMAFTKASQLPSLIEAEQLKLEEMKQSVYDVRDSIDRQIKLYTRSLMESLETLETIITRYKLMQLDLMSNMYYSDTVEALNKIRKELEHTGIKTEEETIKTKQILKVYEGIGTEFEQLVEDYAKLKFDIDSNRWAVRTMKKSTQNDDSAG
ncbi:hypothetical protein LSH36_112g04018 [Paralvinella palmiformis]|uniref:HAUS augmin-like complex subunit 4 n=1 Tax=Paralvinella palmiformis TaxID=53620 RepID=A0AAD9JZ03_9ANNE|nr:hypothetical protein LSH36_112g04018 [Paralvinella palmiformis]